MIGLSVSCYFSMPDLSFKNRTLPSLPWYGKREGGQVMRAAHPFGPSRFPSEFLISPRCRGRRNALPDDSPKA